MNIQDTIKERKITHGDFDSNARLSQQLKEVMHDGAMVTTLLTDIQAEALEIILQKIARICTGNPNHADHWHDIKGYATLAEQEIYERGLDD